MSANIWTVIKEFQENLPTLGYDSINPHFKSKFVTLGKITNNVLPWLNERGVVYVSHGELIDGQLMFVSHLRHVESDTAVSSALPFGNTDAQKIGSAITYFRRYSLSAMLGILTDEDDDANAAMPAKVVEPPKEWRKEIVNAATVDVLTAVYNRASAEGWATQDVMAALTARKKALTDG